MKKFISLSLFLVFLGSLVMISSLSANAASKTSKKEVKVSDSEALDPASEELTSEEPTPDPAMEDEDQNTYSEDSDDQGSMDDTEGSDNSMEEQQ